MAQDNNSLYNYTYNSGGQLTGETVTYPGYSSSPLVTLGFSYDAFGNRTGMTDSLGGSMGYTYNGENQMTGMPLALNGTTAASLTMNYDGLARLSGTTMSTPTGATIASTNSYDNASRLTNINYTNGGSSLASYNYTYNHASEITNYQDNSGNALAYGYDYSGELTSATGTLAASNYNQTWSYDANGNRTTSGFSTGTGNELLSDGTWNYKYDAAGNTILKTNISSGEYWTYTWNDANQLTVAADYQSNGTLIQSVTFQYDVFGNRVEEDVYNASTQVTTVTKFAYNANGNIWADLNASNQLVDRRLFVNVNGQTQPFARIDASNNVSWYLTDHLGSIRLITDNTGTVIDQIDYDAWGNITNETNPTNGDTYKYASGQYDTTLGMSLHAQNSTGRWYMASNGNWLNADPTGLAAGPNPYDYVGNNSTNAIDPSGLAVWTWEQVKALAEKSLDAKKESLKPGEKDLRIKILENVFHGKVDNIGNRRGDKWEKKNDGQDTWYVFKDDPVGAIESVWKEEDNLIFCAPYVQLCILKGNVDLASERLKKSWNKEWKGISVNEIAGVGENRFWMRGEKAAGYTYHDLLPGDNIWFRNSFYQDDINMNEIRDNRRSFSGEEGSNVFYIGAKRGIGYVISIYTHQVYSIHEYQERMLTWNSVEYVKRRDNIGNIDIVPKEAFPITDIRRPIVTNK